MCENEIRKMIWRGRLLKLLDIPDTGSWNPIFEKTIVGFAKRVGPEI